MKKRLMTAILAAMLLLLTACSGTAPARSGKTDGSEGNIQISMCLWDKAMSKQLTPWLQEKFPEIEFSFIVGYNTMAYYTDLSRRGEIPDIITCRRLSLNDAAHLSDMLLDLSQTEVVGTFYDSYIENNREPGGAIRWLPMCAEVDGYMANVDLFEQYGIPLPTNYAEFVDAIARFEENGIKGVSTDWRSDYSCLEMMQGSAIPELMSLEGTAWRQKYEIEDMSHPVGLDDQVWPAVFQKFAQYLTDIRVQPEDADFRWNQVSPMFVAGELAILRATANDCSVTRQNTGINCVMLPYFGETSDDNWILTYPLCQLAVSQKVDETPAKREAVMKVLDAIFSEEGQSRLASGAAVLSYNKTVSIEMGEALSVVRECVERNHMYMRLASTEIFDISKRVVQKMIKGEYGEGFGPEAAYADFNAQLIANAEAAPAEVLITQETAYPYALTDTGNPAASSLMNTLRKSTGDDIAIGYSNVVSSPVFKGDYTEQQLKWLMGFKTIIYQAEYTGAEVQRLMDWLVNVKEDGSNPIRHQNTIPVTSGMEYTMKRTGNGTYELESITIGGKPLDPDALYRVLLLGEDDYMQSMLYCNCPMPEDLKEKRTELRLYEEDYNSYNILLHLIVTNGQLEAPSAYVTIH